MYACDGERDSEHYPQPAVDSKLAAIRPKPSRSCQNPVGHRDDSQRYERHPKRRYHPKIAVEQLVGQWPGRRCQRHQRQEQNSSGEYRGAAYDRQDALAGRHAVSHVPDELLLNGKEQSQTEQEDDRPQHRHGRHSARAQAMASNRELDVGSPAEHH